MTASAIIALITLVLQVVIITLYWRAISRQQDRIDELTERLSYRSDAEYQRSKDNHKSPDRPRKGKIDRWEGRDIR